MIVFKNFRLQVILRICLLALFIAGWIWAMQTRGIFQPLSIFLFVLHLAWVFSLIHFVESTNRNLRYFLEGIRFEDFNNLSRDKHKGKSFAQLQGVYEQINAKFRSIRIQQEAQHQFLQAMVESVEVGIICFRENGEVELINQAAKKLLQKPYLVNQESLRQIHPSLYQKVKNMRSGDRELLRIPIQETQRHFSLQLTQIILLGQSLRFLSIQDLRNELEIQEFLAWQKLIRILTHEIMNSVAPIASLSSGLEEEIEHWSKVPPEEAEPVLRGLQVIKRRSEHLLGFTETYRNLIKIPVPKFERIDLKIMVQQAVELFRKEWEKRGIEIDFHFPEKPVFIQADPILLEQVLINLLKNSLDALREKQNGKLTLRISSSTKAKVRLQITDNGQGIRAEDLDQIFVPFFSTKKEGSGIGLSLSRQIILMHKGSIQVNSELGVGTSVQLIL